MRGRSEENGNGNGNDKENGDGSYSGFLEMGEEAGVEAEEKAESGSAAPIFPPYLEATEPTDEEKRVNRANAGGI
jgi:hypothetical protein